MSKVYSPSQTEDYLWCPMYRALRQEGWTPKTLGNKDYAGILGAAFAAGMAAYNLQGGHRTAIEAGQREVRERLGQLATSGRISPELLEQSLIMDRLQRAITKSIENDPIPPQWERKHVEYEIPGSGKARIDLGLWDGTSPVVVDYKLKTRLEARWRHKELDKWRRSWQMFHYAFFYGQDQKSSVERYIVILTVLEPKFEIIPLDLTTVWITPEQMAQWHSFATQVWSDMEAEEVGSRMVRGRLDCTNQYGPCDMVRACWSFHYDEGLMGGEYVRVQRD